MASQVETATPSSKKLLTQIFAISVLSLFLEMALIRWISGEVRIFAYLQSAVLVVCMLGLGLGCFAQKKNINLRVTALSISLLAALVALPPTGIFLQTASDVLSSATGFNIWSQFDIGMGFARLVSSVGLSILILALVLIAFLPVGKLLGHLLGQHPSTTLAYSVNIVGSGVGIALFTGMSLAGVGAAAWFLLVSALLIPFLIVGQQNRALLVALSLGPPLVLTLASPLLIKGKTYWSPYQKLTLDEVQVTDPGTGYQARHYMLYTNNALYQAMLDLRPQTLAAAPALFPPRWAGLSQYDLPLAFKPKPKRVLVVGAGSGNDVAGALRGGAAHVVAVDIDPVIVQLGRQFHPERPYDSPAVEVVIDDARSFFVRSKEKFDLIIFGLLDSHTTGEMNNARLDNYVYTKESIISARKLLAPGGVMTLSFEAYKPFLSDRIFTTLSEVFHSSPLVVRVPYSSSGFGGVMFVSGDPSVIQQSLADNPRLADHVRTLQTSYPVHVTGTTPPTTDDWPYLYLEKPSIPALFWALVVILLGLFWYSGRKLGFDVAFRTWGSVDLHFFFMGAAFMLLEVTMIARTTVAFGNTWAVNAIVIGGILTMILAGNWLASRWPNAPRHWLFAGLIATCLGVAAINPVIFADNSPAGKLAMVTLTASIPVLFSGIIFIGSFAAVPDKARALGANLFGSLVGGLLQTTAYVTGVRSLLLMVALFYVAAAVTAAACRKVQASEARA